MTQPLTHEDDPGRLGGYRPGSGLWVKLVRNDLLLRLRWRAEAQVSRVTLWLSWGARAVLYRVRPESGLANRPRQSCFLCTTWRTGSTFLGDAVLAAVDLDLSREPFYLSHQQASLGAVLRGRSLLLYLDRVVVARGTNQHGIFGTKTMWTHFQEVLRCLRAIPEYRSLGEFEVLRSVFPEPVFLFLTRRDKLRQAISFYRAQTSQVWHRDDSGRLYTTPGPARVDPEYDYVRIRAARETIRKEEEGWRDFFHRNGIQPLEMSYEETCENLPAVRGRILERLGHRVQDERLGGARSKYVKLADPKTEEWVERFRSDSGKAM